MNCCPKCGAERDTDTPFKVYLHFKCGSYQVDHIIGWFFSLECEEKATKDLAEERDRLKGLVAELESNCRDYATIVNRQEKELSELRGLVAELYTLTDEKAMGIMKRAEAVICPALARDLAEEEGN